MHEYAHLPLPLLAAGRVEEDHEYVEDAREGHVKCVAERPATTG